LVAIKSEEGDKPSEGPELSDHQRLYQRKSHVKLTTQGGGRNVTVDYFIRDIYIASGGFCIKSIKSGIGIYGSYPYRKYMVVFGCNKLVYKVVTSLIHMVNITLSQACDDLVNKLITWSLLLRN